MKLHSRIVKLLNSKPSSPFIKKISSALVSSFCGVLTWIENQLPCLFYQKSWMSHPDACICAFGMSCTPKNVRKYQFNFAASFHIVRTKRRQISTEVAMRCARSYKAWLPPANQSSWSFASKSELCVPASSAL